MIRKECLFPPGLLRPPSPWAGLPCGRSHPLVASRIAGSAGCSVRRPRQSHRRERRLRHAHVPSGSKGRGTRDLAFTFPARRAIDHGGDERAARRVCAADVRCAGWLRSADPPALPRGSRPRFGRQQWVVCCARRGLAHVAASATSATSRPAVNRMCSHPAIAVPTGRRSAVAAPYGKCREITYSYRQLQTPGGSDASGNGLSGTESGPRGRDHGTPGGHRGRRRSAHFVYTCHLRKTTAMT